MKLTQMFNKFKKKIISFNHYTSDANEMVNIPFINKYFVSFYRGAVYNFVPIMVEDVKDEIVKDFRHQSHNECYKKYSEYVKKDESGITCTFKLPAFCKITLHETNVPTIIFASCSIVHPDYGFHCTKYFYISTDALEKCCIMERNYHKGDTIEIYGNGKNISWLVNGQTDSKDVYDETRSLKVSLRLLYIFYGCIQETINSFGPGIMNTLEDFFDTVKEAPSHSLSLMDNLIDFFDKLVDCISKINGEKQFDYLMPNELYQNFLDNINNEASRLRKKIEDEDMKVKKFEDSIKNRKELIEKFNRC